ncbi:MAG: alkyl sulfatase dimerization domain-containing protein, partial [Halioglobus sp.]|nr:alkyl sulfatase dimerization domain-containing protein [Halioglobus sp.]
ADLVPARGEAMMKPRSIQVLAALLLGAATLWGSATAAAPEYQSVIATDPEVRERFAYLLSQSRPRVDRVTEGVYLARGFGQGSAIMVEGDDAVAIFDVGDSYEHGQAMLAEFRKFSDKPIRAIIYSHFHFDHIFGGKAWVEAAPEDVQIIAHESTLRYLNERVSALAPRTDWGLAMQFGMQLDESCAVGSGPLCSGVMGIQFPRIGSTKGQRRHVIYPNRTFSDRLELDLGGLILELIHSPSETPDNILAWLPDRKTLLTGDALTPTLPPIFTARGQRVRDPQTWMASIDLMRALQPQHVVPSHGPAFSGEQAARTLLDYRDAIAFMYHQTVRLINRGLGPEEIAAQLTLPAHLANSPVLGQWYNDLQTDIRGIYSYLAGHYHDVAEMPLLDPAVADANMIALAGGSQAYLLRLQEAFKRGDYVWVARAAGHLIRSEPDNQAAKALKAAALRALAGRTVAGSHRHFYLQQAAALEGLIDIPVVARFTAEDVSTVPVDSLVAQLPFRLDGMAAIDQQQRLSLAITDLQQRFNIDLRHGVAEVVPAASTGPADLSMDSDTFRLFYIGRLSLETGFSQGRMRGELTAAQSFIDYFDWP